MSSWPAIRKSHTWLQCKKRRRKRLYRLMKNAARSHFLQADGCAGLPLMWPIKVFSGISTILQPRSITEMYLEQGYPGLWKTRASKRVTAGFFVIVFGWLCCSVILCAHACTCMCAYTRMSARLVVDSDQRSGTPSPVLKRVPES